MSVHFLGRLGGPDEVVEHARLEPEVKRATLASWASHACAVRSRPTLCKPPELDAPIEVSDVLAALRRLEGAQQSESAMKG